MKSEQLIKARKLAGFKTQKDFAKAIGLSRGHYNRLENCVMYSPSVKVIIKMSIVLSIKPTQIIKWFSNMSKQDIEFWDDF